MIKVTQRGDFKNLDKFFVKSVAAVKPKKIDLYAQRCIEKLIEATPKDSGITSQSWEYSVIKRGKSWGLEIRNTNIQNGLNVALLLEYGYLTRDGRWIEGINFIDPVILNTYLEMMKKSWKEIKRL